MAITPIWPRSCIACGRCCCCAPVGTSAAQPRPISAAHWRSPRQQESPALQLRAARDLARLLAEQGERRQAYDLLAPIYGWFTEGFDTPDLIEAKALLEELRD